MSTIRRLPRWMLCCRVAVALLALVPLRSRHLSATEPAAVPATGSLSIALHGLPEGASPTVTITGPNGFTRTAAGAQVLTDLPSGSYTLTASSIVAGGYTYAPISPSQDATIRDGVSVTADFTYLIRDGALQITLLNLPDSTRPGVTVTGPGGYFQRFEGAEITVPALVPGGYTITAEDVPVGDTVYSAVPGSQVRTVTLGNTLLVQVNYGGGPPPPPPAARFISFSPGFHDRAMTVDSVLLRYRIFIPAGYDPTIPYPVVLFAHGSGEAGTDNVRQTTVGLGAYLTTHAWSFPAVVIFPQQPAPGVLPAGLGAIREMYLTALDSTLIQVNSDTTRLYLTGVSLGGFRTWGIAYAHPTRFAAIAPISGGVTPGEVGATTEAEAADSVAHRLRDLPIWVWNGDADRQVSFEKYAAPLRDAFIAIGSPQTFHFIVGSGLGHDLQANYNNPDFWRWLFAQHR